jgi:hypothetical protein
VLLLIDQTHCFGTKALDLLLKQLLAQNSLANIAQRDPPRPAGAPPPPRAPVRVVFAFSGYAKDDGYASQITAQKEFIRNNRGTYLRYEPLQAFRSPSENRLAYQQHLLTLEPPDGPLVPRSCYANAAKVGTFFEKLHQVVGGIPSELMGEKAAVALLMARDDELGLADDEARLPANGGAG